MSSNLVRATDLSLALEQTFDAAKAAAIEEFASAKVEEVMLRAADTRLAVLEARRQLVLRTFNVTDVAKLGEKLAKNKYAAEKLQQIFGGAFELLKDQTGRPLCDIQIVKDDPDVGEVRIYTYYGRYTRTDGLVVEQMGSFSTKDPFFAKAGNVWKSLSEINVTDVMVAAQTETYKKCLFRGTGLGDWTESEGTDLQSAAKGHDFKGSAAKTKDVEDLVLPFGHSKGTKLTEAPTADLEYVLKTTEASIKDPEKKKYLKSNEKMRDAITSVLAMREQKVAAGGAGSTEGAGAGQGPGSTDGGDTQARNATQGQPASSDSTAPAASPATRGQLISRVFTKLEKVTERDQKKHGALLRMISRERWEGKEIGLLSDFKTEQLAEILEIPDETLVNALKTL
jgi:hypothetical protein